MKNIKVLDCTLRDGGYINNTEFSYETIQGIISGLTAAGINIIECGFLKDMPEHQKDNTVFNNVEQVKEYLPQSENKNISYVLLADCSRYKANDLTPYDGTGIDGIRECFQKNERDEALSIAKKMKNMGYKVFIQPVDILGYSDSELLELITKVNELSPYAFSMVDTFGSMYIDDLRRLYSLVHHNLNTEIVIGFHSHNNLQMSFALAQEFIQMSIGQRQVIVDATMCGMGRGAGNTNTELVVDYLNRKYQYSYDMDGILDIVDIYMLQILDKYEWGYSVPNFIAGMYSTHVHNISYLTDKHNINSRNMRKIIESLDVDIRKKYDYDNLEETYVKFFERNVNDEMILKKIKADLKDKNVLLLASGSSLKKQKKCIEQYIEKYNTVNISVNMVSDEYQTDYIFFSNFRRYELYQKELIERRNDTKIILTSNVETDEEMVYGIINYNNVIKRGWKYFDSSTILLLRLLFSLDIRHIAVAGFDGYNLSQNEDNYLAQQLEIHRDEKIFTEINRETREMLQDLREQFSLTQDDIIFVTDSMYN